MFQLSKRLEVSKSKLAVSAILFGATLFVGLDPSTGHAQAMTEYTEIIRPETITEEFKSQAAKAPECELLNRTSTVSVENDGTKLKVIHYVIASNSNAHPDVCLRYEIDSACNLSEPVEKIAIDFTSLTNGSFYKASRTYRLSGVCVESSDPNDVRLVKGGDKVLNYERRRHFNMVTDWTEKKN